MKRERVWLSLWLLVTIAALAGCDLGGPAPSPTPAASPTAQATVAVPPTSPIPTPTALATAVAQSPFAQTGAALDALPSYQWTARWSLTASQGGAVSPLSWRSEGTRVKDGDRWHITWTLGTGDVALEVVHIGSQEWVKFGEQWVETPKEQQLQFLRLAPRGWWSSVAIGLEGNTTRITADERVNDALCAHYRTTSGYQGVLVSGGTNWTHQGDVWLAVEGSYPVRGRFLGTGTIQGATWTLTQELDITHTGDPANAVSPPK